MKVILLKIIIMHAKKNIGMKNVLNNILLVLHILKQKKQDCVSQQNIINNVHHLNNINNQIIQHYVRILVRKENITVNHIIATIFVLISVNIININMMKT